MKKWRHASATLIVLVGLSVPFTAAAASFQIAAGLPPDNHLMRVILIVTGIVVALFGFAKGMNWLFWRPAIEILEAKQKALIETHHLELKDFLRGEIARLGEGFQGIMDRHTDSGDPHPDASKRMHGELERSDAEILEEVRALREGQRATQKTLAKLVRAHNAAMSTERRGGLPPGCYAARDPADSPYPRRSTDPEEFDANVAGPGGTSLRGKHALNPIVIEEEEEGA